jgi:hypothetical protein
MIGTPSHVACHRHDFAVVRSGGLPRRALQQKPFSQHDAINALEIEFHFASAVENGSDVPVAAKGALSDDSADFVRELLVAMPRLLAGSGKSRISAQPPTG